MSKLNLSLNLSTAQPAVPPVTAAAIDPDQSVPLNDSNKVGLAAHMAFTVAGGNGTVQEVVHYTSATGCLAGIGSSHGDHSIMLHAGVGGDEHGVPLLVLFPGGRCTSDGSCTASQYWKYRGDGGTFHVIPNSGFTITRTVTRISDTECTLSTTKQGAGVTITGVTVTAGGGTKTVNQRIVKTETGYTVTTI